MPRKIVTGAFVDVAEVNDHDLAVPFADPFADAIEAVESERLARAVKAVVMLCFPAHPGRRGGGVKNKVDTAFLRFAALAYRFNAAGLDVRSQREYAQTLGVNFQTFNESLKKWNVLLAGEQEEDKP
jgi:hypothetical protein